MRTFSSVISLRRQATIPVEVLQLLGVQPGDRIEFQVDAGVVRLQRAAFTLETAFQSVPPLHRPEDFEALIRIAKETRGAP